MPFLSRICLLMSLFDDDVDLFDAPPDDAQGDGVVAEEAIVVPLVGIPIIEISSDHSVPVSFESVSSSALQAVDLRRYVTDTDNNTAMSVAPIPPRDVEPGLELDFIPIDQPVDAPANPEPMLAPKPLPDFDPIPFGTPDIAPLILDPIPAPANPAAFASQVDPVTLSPAMGG
ncbi:hypothetical protein Hanom_Chr06g00530231 [Helianthus anomalus]